MNITTIFRENFTSLADDSGMSSTKRDEIAMNIESRIEKLIQ